MEKEDIIIKDQKEEKKELIISLQDLDLNKNKTFSESIGQSNLNSQTLIKKPTVI